LEKKNIVVLIVIILLIIIIYPPFIRESEKKDEETFENQNLSLELKPITTKNYISESLNILINLTNNDPDELEINEFNLNNVLCNS